MVISTTKIFNTIQWLITVFLIASFLLFDAYEWGKYSFVICTAVIFLMTVLKNGGKVKLRFEPFIVMFFVFIVYVAVTAIWAVSSTDSLTMARTLFRTLVCYALIYWSYMEDPDPIRLVTAMVAASYVVAIYSVVFFGFDQLIYSSDEIYENTAFANLNSIALFLAFGFICDIYLNLFHKFRLYSLISIVSIVVISAMRSRKAIIVLIIGVLALFLFRYAKSKSIGYRILRIAFIIVVILLVIYFLSRLSVFTAVNERFGQLIDTFYGIGKMDRSTLLRERMITLGLYCFGQRPITGIGMACTHYYAANGLYFDSYLHNNYVELLAGGGLIAFILFYAMYGYLIKTFFKMRDAAPQWFVFGIVIIALLLITDYGRVSYYSKTVLFQLMILFLTVRIVNENRKDIQDGIEAH